MKRTATIVAVSVLLMLPVCGQDVLRFTSGKTYECEIVKFEKNLFTVRLADGSLKDAPAASVTSIAFAPNAQALNIVATDGVSNAAPRVSGGSFRQAQWGMSKEEVKKTETGDILRDDETVLAYKDSVSGLDALVVYIFAGNRLVRAKYSFINKHANKNDFMTDFSSIADAMIAKYGKPKENRTIWKKELWRDNRDHWGMAISTGDLVFLKEWDAGDTEICHILSGDNFDISHVVEYTSKSLKSLEETKKKETERQKL